jgi:HEPN superfamily AbiU2-like protein
MQPQTLSSPRLASIMNIRDKHIAHSLEATHREKKEGPVQPMKYGDETKLLNASIPILERLYWSQPACVTLALAMSAVRPRSSSALNTTSAPYTRP